MRKMTKYSEIQYIDVVIYDQFQKIITEIDIINSEIDNLKKDVHNIKKEMKLKFVREMGGF